MHYLRNIEIIHTHTCSALLLTLLKCNSHFFRSSLDFPSNRVRDEFSIPELRSQCSIEEGSRSDEENCSKPHESKEGHEVRQNQIKFKADENPANLSLSLLEDLEGQMKNKLKDQTLAMKKSR